MVSQGAGGLLVSGERETVLFDLVPFGSSPRGDGRPPKLKEMLNAKQEHLNEPDDAEAFDRARWAQFCDRFRREVGEAVYASWFKSLELQAIVDGVACLTVPTKFLKSWIHAHYFDRLAAALKSEMPGVEEISIELRGARARPAASARGSQAAAAAPAVSTARAAVEKPADTASAIGGSALDKRFRFENFLVGASNQLAHAAARQVADHPSQTGAMFNPLYFFANVGLGKTHLIQAIAHAGQDAGRRVVYLTAEKFMYGFVAALKRQDSIGFKESLRSIDLLVIDDVQFLQGKTIQQEFCHTLNALIDSGRQVVIAGDRPPNDLENLDERVRSRFAGGLCVEILPLDEDLRQSILRSRIETLRLNNPKFDAPDAVIELVARQIDTNGRDLDGAVNRLLAHTILAGSTLTVEAAEAAIRDLVRVKEPKKVKIEDIQRLVADRFNVSRADILSSRRTANVVRPRQIAMYLAKTLTLRSLPEIGRRFGGRDHTTVLHAVRKIEDIATKDAQLSQELELLKRMLGE